MAKRNWPEYNKKLVNETMTCLLTLSKGTVNENERCKERQDFPNSLILIILTVKEHFGPPYRGAEGLTKLLGGIWGKLPMPRYAGGRRGSMCPWGLTIEMGLWT